MAARGKAGPGRWVVRVKHGSDDPLRYVWSGGGWTSRQSHARIFRSLREAHEVRRSYPDPDLRVYRLCGRPRVDLEALARAFDAKADEWASSPLRYEARESTREADALDGVVDMGSRGRDGARGGGWRGQGAGTMTGIGISPEALYQLGRLDLFRAAALQALLLRGALYTVEEVVQRAEEYAREMLRVATAGDGEGR